LNCVAHSFEQINSTTKRRGATLLSRNDVPVTLKYFTVYINKSQSQERANKSEFLRLKKKLTHFREEKKNQIRMMF